MNIKPSFVPVHAAHAIEQSMFVLQFANPISDDLYKEIVVLADKFMNELPGKRELQQAILTNIPPSPNAVAYAKYNDAGLIENELQIHKSAIFFTTRQYSRWTEIWTQASKYFAELVPFYSSQAKLSNLGLSYTDKFICENEIQVNPKSFLKTDSKFITSHIFETDQLWHSHTGVFEKADESTKRLININLDYLDERHINNNRFSVVVTTTINDQFDQPSYKPLNITSESTMDFISEHMANIHDAGKIILSEIINADMAKQIALTD